ncbi:transposase [Tychonema sp. LEGE 07196]|uniref:transposase n=1 Tax=Tychonema sp. LEGE 07196 TaxID=1828665 RepID=UPI0034CFB4F4
MPTNRITGISKVITLNESKPNGRAIFPSWLVIIASLNGSRIHSSPYARIWALARSACTGISFMDSTCLKVTRNRRISQHKVFKDIAARWKTERRLVLWFKVTSSHQRSRRVT